MIKFISFAGNSSNSFNRPDVWDHNIVAVDEAKLLTWLSPLDPWTRHRDIRTRRAANVGEWILQTNEFRRWCECVQQDGSEYATLFFCGDPGVGKTYFSSLVVDGLCDRAEEENIAVACFYVDFAARDQQTPRNMLGSLLKQIVSGLERIPEKIVRTFQDSNNVIGGRRLRVHEIVRMLQTVTSLKPTFICVDAIDACVERDRREVLDALNQILESSPNTRIFLTGRRHIRSEIERQLAGRVATLSIKLSDDDITGYIRMRLNEDTSPDAMDNALEAEIIKSIAEGIPETCLLISLAMDAILQETTAHSRRKKLGAITDGLDLKGAYGATLERIQELGGEKARLGMAALMWISHSERLLKLDELLHALAVEIGSTDLDPESIPSVETLLCCCLGLVVIDEEASVVRLIHFTLREYLYTRPDLFGATHSIMAEICLTYLNFRTITDISPTLFAPPQSTPFLEYASLNWGSHARREASMEVVSLALNLFSQIETHISTKLLLLETVSKAGRYNRDIPTNGHLVGFTGLHCASVFGIVEIANVLMGQPGCDLNKRDFLGMTSLVWAAICGQEEVVKLLLERQTIIPDKPDKLFRRTALSWAAWKGDEGIVKIILGRASAKPNGADVWWAGAPRAKDILLGKRYVNPNMPDKYGQMPLSLAAEEGHEGVVKLLLGRKDVKPDAADGYGRTPLFLASSRGQDEVVKLLVEREDVNIDKQDKIGETPLLSATLCGHSVATGLLLERKDANSDMGKYCQTLLFLAAERGHDGVVRLLLGREDVNPDMRDNNGWTPLSLAAGNGHNEVVKLLLGRGDVHPDMPDNSGWTPLSLAAGNGRNEAAKLLLGRKDVNPDLPDNSGRTPLSWAAGNGHNEIVKLLLGRKEVTPDMPDNGGRTPLSWAAGLGRNEAVKLLVGRQDVNPNMPDIAGRAPLSWAAVNWHNRAVKLLLEREDAHPNMSKKKTA